MKDFFTFRRMLTPVLIQIAMFIGMLTLILTGLYGMFYEHAIIKGLIVIILGPIAMRLSAELLIVMFRVNETMTDIHNTLRQLAERSH